MIETLGRLSHEAGPALLGMLAASVALLGIAGAAATALRGASASVRHLVWASALCGLLVLPLATLLMPGIAVRVLPRSGPVADQATIGHGAPERATPGQARRAAERPAPAAEPDEPVGSAGAGVLASAGTPVPEPGASGGAATWVDAPGWTWRSLLVTGWAVVALVLLIEAGLSRLRLRVLGASAWRVHDPSWLRAAHRVGQSLGLRRPVSLLASDRTRVPLTWGTRQPIVLIPEDAQRWPADRREAVLVHELAHVARGDALGHEIARVAAALFWINPLAWLALRAMRAERERACDDLVLATGTRASSYAGDLLEIARAVGSGSPRAAAALAMARPSELEGRLLAILDPARPREPVGRRARIAATVIALLLIIPLAALRPVEREPATAIAVSGAQGTEIASEGSAAPVRPPGVLDSTGVRSRRSSGTANGPADSGPRGPERSMLPAVYDAFSMPPLASTAAQMPRPSADAVSGVELDAPPTYAIVAPPPDASALPERNDVETLRAVARAAAGMSSASDKAEVLLAVIARGIRDDSLHRLILSSASTIQSGHQRHRVMVAMLERGMVEGSELPYLAAAAGIQGTHERGVVLGAFARTLGLTSEAIRDAYLRGVGASSSSYQRARLLELVIRDTAFDAAAALDVLPLVRAMSSNSEKAKLLRAIAARGVLRDPSVRDAFLIAAGSLSSTSDRRRVLDAAGLTEAPRRQ